VRSLGLVLLACAAGVRAQETDPAAVIEQVLAGGDALAARRTLVRYPDREKVVALIEQALARDVPGVRAKASLLALLGGLGRTELAQGALASPVLSTRRAAAAQFPTDEGASKILLDWLGNAGAPDRDLAVDACTAAKIAEARPLIVPLITDAATDPKTFAAAARSLGRNPPPAIGEAVKTRLAKKDGDPQMIGACLDLARWLPDLHADELIVYWLRDRDAPVMVRGKAALAAHDVAPVEAVLLDPDEPDAIVQRTCLYRVLNQVTDEPLLKLLRDPRVNRNRYFGVRVDVATALACVKGTGPGDLELLCDYLVDEDPQDKDHIVRSEAWLTLWTLTGRMHGAETPAMFEKVPQGGLPEMRTRRSYLRAGVGRRQARELERLAADLDRMRKVREAYVADLEAAK